MRLIKILFWLCLIFFVISLLVYTIQCIISAWWNILLIIIILLTLWWYKIRRKNQKSVWQGVIIIILSLLLLAWFLIPCIFGHFKDLEEEPETDTEMNHHQVLTDDEEDKEKKQQAEKEKEQQVEREKEQQAEREKVQKQQACSNIRGNVSSSGTKIYHVPSGQFYDKTEPEETFCTEAEAKSAGYRKSKL
ncbi:sunset domain-containing protein [Peribacillus frigoritolerans]|uniref:sunset domain-containing protein n=1 Tax=Peribacillus frigoritolerans TaxID=450367 RepID=UPI0033068E3A